MDDVTLKVLAEAQDDWVIGLRRRLHRIPEIGDQEFKTQALVMETLDALGIEHSAVATGVVGLILGGRPGPTVALRADMDALPVTEPVGCAFRSEHEGFMHACGHDAHTSILLGAAKLLHEMRAELSGNAKLLFQPAEEARGGAVPLIRAGALENPHVDRVYGLHVMPHLPAGTIETRVGTLNASSDTVTIRIIGRSGHGAYPERSADAIACAAQVISALQTLVSRNVAPTESAVLSFGMIQGGVASNVICGEVNLKGTLRTINPVLREMMMRRLYEVVQGVSSAMGLSAEVTVDEGYCALVNHREDALLVLKTAARLLGGDRVVEKEAPSMGAEDFSYYIQDTPGSFYHLGCADPSGPIPAAPLHSPDFSVDERCLKVGVMMHAALALAHLK